MRIWIFLKYRKPIRKMRKPLRGAGNA